MKQAADLCTFFVHELISQNAEYARSDSFSRLMTRTFTGCSGLQQAVSGTFTSPTTGRLHLRGPQVP
jgi:hypothetical protein